VSTSRYQKLNNRKRRIQYRLRERLWAPQDQPMFRARNIHYELSDRLRGLAPGGMGAMHHLARRVGLIPAIDRYLHLLKIHLPYHESDHVLNVAYNILAGGTCLEDLELWRNDEVYLDALGAQRIPDPTTEGDFCRRFTAVDVEILQDTLNEVRLGVVNGTIALTRRPATRATNSTIGASAWEEAGKLSCAAGYRHSQCIHDRLEEVHRKRANRPSPAFSPVPVRVRSRPLEAAGGIGGLLAVYDLNDTPGAGQTGDDLQYVYTYDGNGNVVQVLDWSASSATNAIVAKHEYDPYGNVVAQAGGYAERNPFRFSTKQWDDETGFGYWEQRYYSPRLGRWISRDPIGELDDRNLYRFAKNAGVAKIDALGLWGNGKQYYALQLDQLLQSEGPLDLKRLFELEDAWLKEPRGHSDFVGYPEFDWVAEDEDPWTSPWNPFGGTKRHFMSVPELIGQVKAAIKCCRKGDFERAIHRGQDVYSHYDAGWRWWTAGHVFGGHEPDDSRIHRTAWEQANFWTAARLNEWYKNCCKDAEGNWGFCCKCDQCCGRASRCR